MGFFVFLWFFLGGFFIANPDPNPDLFDKKICIIFANFCSKRFSLFLISYIFLRIQEGKNDSQKWRNVKLRRAGCYFLGDIYFSFSLDVLCGGLRISISERNINIVSCKYLSIFGHLNRIWIWIRIDQKCWIRIRIDKKFWNRIRIDQCGSTTPV